MSRGLRTVGRNVLRKEGADKVSGRALYIDDLTFPNLLHARTIRSTIPSGEIVDVRSLRPLDERTILASVAKTGRVVIVHEAPRTAGFGAELAALIAERAIFDLQGPVLRVTGYDVPYPYWTIEDAYMPSVERVAAAVRSLL